MGQEDLSKEESPCGSEKNADSDTLLDRCLLGEHGSKHDYVRSKMEAMQRRIDELKEKIRHEKDFMHKEEAGIKPESLDENVEDLQNTLGMSDQRSESSSEKSLYFSASNYSIGSLSSGSADTVYSRFTRFVSNFVRTQGSKERASLLQLHSNSQISMNMMKHSLTELETGCSYELEVVQKHLQHLERLAGEFGVDLPPTSEPEALSLDAIPLRRQRVRSNLTLIWPPLKTDQENQFEWNQNSEVKEKVDNCNLSFE